MKKEVVIIFLKNHYEQSNSGYREKKHFQKQKKPGRFSGLQGQKRAPEAPEFEKQRRLHEKSADQF